MKDNKCEVETRRHIKNLRLTLSIIFTILLTLPEFGFKTVFIFIPLVFMFNYFIHYNHVLVKKFILREMPFYIVFFVLFIDIPLGYACWHIRTSGLYYQSVMAVFGAILGFIYSLISIIILLIMRKSSNSEHKVRFLQTG